MIRQAPSLTTDQRQAFLSPWVDQEGLRLRCGECGRIIVTDVRPARSPVGVTYLAPLRPRMPAYWVLGHDGGPNDQPRVVTLSADAPAPIDETTPAGVRRQNPYPAHRSVYWENVAYRCPADAKDGAALKKWLRGGPDGALDMDARPRSGSRCSGRFVVSQDDLIPVFARTMAAGEKDVRLGDAVGLLTAHPLL